MKAVVIFKSKTGFAKKYAEWIAKELSADIFDAAKIRIDALSTYDTVVYGAGLYASGINGVKFITKNFDRLKGKKLIVYASGATPGREKVIEEVRNMNFTLEQQKEIKFFYLRGGFDRDKLKPLDRVLMSLFKIMLKNKKDKTPDDVGMLAAYDTPVDFTREKNINKLVDYAKSEIVS